MADLNLLDFYRDAAVALLQLHMSFPRKIELYVEDLIGPDHTDEFGLHSLRHQACFGTLLWLAEENFLRFASNIRQEGIDQAVLSAKTLVLMNTLVPGLASCDSQDEQAAIALSDTLPRSEQREQQTLVEHMRRAILEQSSGELTEVMREFFTRGASR